MIARLRREYRMTGEEIALRLRLPRSTVASHLRRLGLGRLAALEPSAPAWRYSRARAGELVHLDIKKLARFRRIGHRITGDRRQGSEGAGWEFVHVAVDDASRLAYVEVLPDEKRQSVTGFLVRALRWFKRQGVRVERVMTDNGSGYVSRLFRKVCRLLRLRHIRTRPYTPKTNGKAERFIQTLLREWAYALPYRSSDTAPPICPGGCATTIRSDRMLVSLASHQPPGSSLTPEQPPRNPQLGLRPARPPGLLFPCLCPGARRLLRPDATSLSTSVDTGDRAAPTHKLRWMFTGESWSYPPRWNGSVPAVIAAVLDPHFEQGGNTNVVDTWPRSELTSGASDRKPHDNACAKCSAGECRQDQDHAHPLTSGKQRSANPCRST